MSTLQPGRRVAFDKALLSSDSSDDDLAPGRTTPSDAGSGPPSHRLPREYRVYRWRWLLLSSLCLVNISNGMMWLSFAPIPNYTARYYNVEVADVDWFSIIFFLASLVVGFLSIAILDTFGLRVSLYLGAGLNLLGSVLRYLSTLDPIVCSSVFSRSGFTVAMIGQFLTACAQPFLLYSPTKLASFWFGPKERAICTNFASIANPIGLAVAQLASPYIVTSTERIPMMVRYSSSFFSPSLIFAREKSLHYLRF
ncbi:Solute carrier family 49 member A3, partial [Geodia barretti]